MHRFKYHAPTSLDEAVALLKEHGDGTKLLAGGTDLLVHMKEGGLHPPRVISLHAVAGLDGISFDDSDGLSIGSAVSMDEIDSNDTIRQRYAALAEGAGIVGSVQTRSMATIGGNVANAAPSADTTPPLAVFDAIAQIMGSGGAREIPLIDLFDGPGSTVLAGDEVLTGFTLPTPPANTGSVYQRHTPRKIMDIAAVGVGVRLSLDGGNIGEARICLGAVAATIIRATEAEDALAGQTPSAELFAKAAELAQAASSPISDVRGSAEFRRHLVGVMTKRCLDIALERARS
ncbi:MAG: xanthine dehydrogenase family protein subunit M [Chloroflexi bacterium]|nr:xanthine dehydrogenase family protein subunit M [Chloroflexota bacterium]